MEVAVGFIHGQSAQRSMRLFSSCVVFRDVFLQHIDAIAQLAIQVSQVEHNVSGMAGITKRQEAVFICHSGNKACPDDPIVASFSDAGFCCLAIRRVLVAVIIVFFCFYPH